MQKVFRAEEVHLVGGDGTDMASMIQAAMERRPKPPEVILVATDGYDHEYERKGVCSQILFVEPLRGWRKVFVRQRCMMVARVKLTKIYPSITT